MRNRLITFIREFILLDDDTKVTYTVMNFNARTIDPKDTQMVFSKKELEKFFGVSHATIQRTIEAAGISTKKKKRLYNTEEFIVIVHARKLFEAGYTCYEVTQYFQEKHNSVEPHEG